MIGMYNQYISFAKAHVTSNPVIWVRPGHATNVLTTIVIKSAIMRI
jgi:hypothetical protein